MTRDESLAKTLEAPEEVTDIADTIKPALIIRRAVFHIKTVFLDCE